jgi:carbon storage regulator
MLVLSRKVGEKLNIGDDVEVVVTRVAGNRVTLGVSAPQQVRVVRGELSAIPMQQPETDQPPQHKAA